jgi:hypothetical protein
MNDEGALSGPIVEAPVEAVHAERVTVLAHIRPIRHKQAEAGLM